jgi:hypothetical protein
MRNTFYVAARARLARLAATALAFGALYTASNQFTQARGESSVGNGVFEWERAIPLLPWTIVRYLPIFDYFVLSFMRERRTLDRHVAALTIDLLLSALCRMLVPLRFTFERPRSTDGPGRCLRCSQRPVCRTTARRRCTSACS